MTKPGYFRLLVLIPVLLVAGAAAAQTENYMFHWSPSPESDDEGKPLPAAVEYEIYLQRDLGGLEKIATVIGDTVYTLSAEPDVVHRIRVCGIDASGVQSPLSDWSDPVYFEQDDRSVLVPPAPELPPNYPNPFNPETRIVYGVPQDMAEGDILRLEIYSVKGERILSFDVERTPGWHEVVWDGTNGSGQVAPTGIYLTRFQCGTVVETNKMTMLK